MTNGVMEARMVHALAYFSSINKNKSNGTKVTLEQLNEVINDNCLIDMDIIDILNGVYSNNGKNMIEYICFFETQEELRYVLTKEYEKVVKDNFNYTLKDLKEYVQLNSTYSQELFEFAFSYRGTKSISMTIEDFKKRFRIPDFHNFNIIDASILKHFIKELESKTSFRIKLEKEKNGLKFYFTEERK